MVLPCSRGVMMLSMKKSMEDISQFVHACMDGWIDGSMTTISSLEDVTQYT